VAPDEEETQRILARVVLSPAEMERLLASGDDLDLDVVVAQVVAGPDQVE